MYDDRKGTEYSAGAVVFTRRGDDITYLLMRSMKGVYGFPKGHIEAGETEHETAVREIREETGVEVRFIEGFRMEEEHPIPSKPGIIKHVTYFLAECAPDAVPSPMPGEASDAEFVGYDEAMKLFYYENNRGILAAAKDFISKM